MTPYADIPTLSSYGDNIPMSTYAAITVIVNSLRDLAAIVRGRRLDLGLSQAELATRARVSRQWISGFEGGKATAEIGLVIRVLDALDLRLAITTGDAGDDRRDATAIDLDALLDDHRGP